MLLTVDGHVPVHWWTHAVNFGDLLAPWLVEKITGRKVVYAEQYDPSYLVIGSILGHATPASIVWGTGSFGTEVVRGWNQRKRQRFAPEARYTAVRGPLTRNKLVTAGIPCPRIYGDPALLLPRYHAPAVQKTHAIGVVLRWSEAALHDRMEIEGVRRIYLKSDAIEETIEAFLSCERIVTTSLHGLILADAYGIPNVWLDSDTPHGLEFKYWDYLASVGKTRGPSTYDLWQPGMTVERLLTDLRFDARPIDIDLDALEAVCPFRPGAEPDVVVEPRGLAGKVSIALLRR